MERGISKTERSRVEYTHMSRSLVQDVLCSLVGVLQINWNTIPRAGLETQIYGIQEGNVITIGRLVTVHTYGDFIVLLHWKTRPSAP